MQYTPATLICWNGSKGILKDSFGVEVRFSSKDVHPDDVKVLVEGVELILPSEGAIELATGAFCRFLEENSYVK